MKKFLKFILFVILVLVIAIAIDYVIGRFTNNSITYWIENIFAIIKNWFASIGNK